jgi:uroporphyrinogen decarboxylase
MNKRERLEATIRGEPVDRVAVALWRHWPGDDQRPADLAAAHIDWQDRFDWDFVKVTPASSFCLKDWGIEDEWRGSLEGTRNYVRRVIQSPEDWQALRPLEPAEGGLGQQLECLRLLGDAFRDEVPFIQTVFSPLAQAKYLAGERQLILHLRQNASQVHHGLQTITDTIIRFIQEARATGIAGVFYAVQLANYDIMSEAEYKVFGRPYDLQILKTLDGLWFNMLHLHGPNGMFELITDYPVQAINWHDRETWPDLAAGLRRIKSAASGGVSRDLLHDDDPNPALQQACAAMRETRGRRWILGTGCVTLITTPLGNIRKLRMLADSLKGD